MSKADPLFSAGARLERAAITAYLKEKIATVGINADIYKVVLRWVQGRHKRYDKKPGGLGK